MFTTDAPCSCPLTPHDIYACLHRDEAAKHAALLALALQATELAQFIAPVQRVLLPWAEHLAPESPGRN